jgi:hypothetical protein
MYMIAVMEPSRFPSPDAMSPARDSQKERDLRVWIT